jgi:hypothetical protein
MKFHWNFSQRTHPIHSIGPKTHVLAHFGPFSYCLGPKTHVLARFVPFRYCTKVDAKLAEMAPLTHKFAKGSYVGVFGNERT